jgi:hypothetical protein
LSAWDISLMDCVVDHTERIWWLGEYPVSNSADS